MRRVGVCAGDDVVAPMPDANVRLAAGAGSGDGVIVEAVAPVMGICMAASSSAMTARALVARSESAKG